MASRPLTATGVGMLLVFVASLAAMAVDHSTDPTPNLAQAGEIRYFHCHLRVHARLDLH